MASDDMVFHRMAWDGVDRIRWHGIAWDGIGWDGMVWHGMAWYCIGWHQMASDGMVLQRMP